MLSFEGIKIKEKRAKLQQYKYLTVMTDQVQQFTRYMTIITTTLITVTFSKTGGHASF